MSGSEVMQVAEYEDRSALIVGAKGQVGSQLKRALEGEGGRVLATAREPQAGWLLLDLAELSEQAQAATLLDGQALDMVLCAGGMTYVDGCEAEPDLAYRTNARGPGVLAGYAKSRGLPFVYYSTEYVFAGREEEPGPYTEASPTEPLSVYGKSKLAGEEQVLSAHPGALVLRTTVVYGPDEQQKNFVYSVMKNLRAGKVMKVAEDQISTPTYNRDLVKATLGLAGAGASGIFHVCGPELMGRLEFARRVAEMLGLDTSLLQGVSTAELAQVAPRPLHAGLAIGKLQRERRDLVMRTVEDSIRDCREILEP
jgi:dTDP-4-dehydrorhamnose reductase